MNDPNEEAEERRSTPDPPRGTPDLEPMIAKYGHALSPVRWSGLPMRVGSFPKSGRVEKLYTASDVVLVWSGGECRVDIEFGVGGEPPTEVSRQSFVRHGGMVDLLPAGTTLLEVVWEGEEQSCVSVDLLPAVLEEWAPGKYRGLSIRPGPHFNVSEAHIVDIVRRLLAQNMTDEPLGGEYVRSLCQTLASYVFAAFGATPAAPSAHLPELTTEKLVTFVEEHLSMNLELADLARIAGYSSDHFARLFKRSFGVTPNHYIVGRRIERAKVMLRDPQQSIGRIARACGFGTPAYFSQVFKRHTSMTPKAYRKG